MIRSLEISRISLGQSSLIVFSFFPFDIIEINSIRYTKIMERCKKISANRFGKPDLCSYPSIEIFENILLCFL